MTDEREPDGKLLPGAQRLLAFDRFLRATSLDDRRMSPPEHDMGLWLQGFYANSTPLPDNFLADRQDRPPQERDWS